MTANYIEHIPTAPGHYVYRFWAADGGCLYVGCVGERSPRQLGNRFAQHKRKPWWPEVTRIDVAAFGSTQELVAEERAQIAELRPVHNGNLLGTCVKGHDTTAPAARTLSGACKQCMRETNANRDRQKERDYYTRPDIRARRTRQNRMTKRRPGPGQAAMW